MSFDHLAQFGEGEQIGSEGLNSFLFGEGEDFLFGQADNEGEPGFGLGHHQHQAFWDHIHDEEDEDDYYDDYDNDDEWMWDEMEEDDNWALHGEEYEPDNDHNYFEPRSPYTTSILREYFNSFHLLFSKDNDNGKQPDEQDEIPDQSEIFTQNEHNHDSTGRLATNDIFKALKSSKNPPNPYKIKFPWDYSDRIPFYRGIPHACTGIWIQHEFNTDVWGSNPPYEESNGDPLGVDTEYCKYLYNMMGIITSLLEDSITEAKAKNPDLEVPVPTSIDYSRLEAFLSESYDLPGFQINYPTDTAPCVGPKGFDYRPEIEEPKEDKREAKFALFHKKSETDLKNQKDSRPTYPKLDHRSPLLQTNAATYEELSVELNFLIIFGYAIELSIIPLIAWLICPKFSLCPHPLSSFIAKHNPSWKKAMKLATNCVQDYKLPENDFENLLINLAQHAPFLSFGSRFLGIFYTSSSRFRNAILNKTINIGPMKATFPQIVALDGGIILLKKMKELGIPVSYEATLGKLSKTHRSDATRALLETYGWYRDPDSMELMFELYGGSKNFFKDIGFTQQRTYFGSHLKPSIIHLFSEHGVDFTKFLVENGHYPVDTLTKDNIGPMVLKTTITASPTNMDSPELLEEDGDKMMGYLLSIPRLGKMFMSFALSTVSDEGFAGLAMADWLNNAPAGFRTIIEFGLNYPDPELAAQFRSKLYSLFDPQSFFHSVYARGYLSNAKAYPALKYLLTLSNEITKFRSHRALSIPEQAGTFIDFALHNGMLSGIRNMFFTPKFIDLYNTSLQVNKDDQKQEKSTLQNSRQLTEEMTKIFAIPKLPILRSTFPLVFMPLLLRNQSEYVLRVLFDQNRDQITGKRMYPINVNILVRWYIPDTVFKGEMINNVTPVEGTTKPIIPKAFRADMDAYKRLYLSPRLVPTPPPRSSTPLMLPIILSCYDFGNQYDSHPSEQLVEMIIEDFLESIIYGGDDHEFTIIDVPVEALSD